MLATRGQVTGGAVAVDLFFVMSGFLIAASAERSKSIADFLRKRVKRIYPGFVVAALLSLLVVLPVSGGSLVFHGTRGVLDWVGQTLRLTEYHTAHAFAGNPTPGVVNGSTWSIPYEFFCYLGVALLTVAGLLRRRGVVLGLFAGSWVISLVALLQHWIYGGKWLGVALGSPQFWARLLPYYLAGVVFYLWRDRIILRGWLAGMALGMILVGCFVPIGMALLFPIAGSYFIFWLAYTPWLRLPKVARFGDFSYGAYLYAFPVEQMIVQALHGPVRPVVLFALAAPVTMLCALGSWYGVERWFLQPVRRRKSLVEAVAG